MWYFLPAWFLKLFWAAFAHFSIVIILPSLNSIHHLQLWFKVFSSYLQRMHENRVKKDRIYFWNFYFVIISTFYLSEGKIDKIENCAVLGANRRGFPNDPRCQQKDWEHNYTHFQQESRAERRRMKEMHANCTKRSKST